ncbi:UPF0764 protein C16orf89 homolog [Littorina saxatilis]|uniref:Uncharacterized protein n=1 Tax=Littorina saxatilis TaxID=31220 RepID=A0AAN9BUW7_9CAEN
MSVTERPQTKPSWLAFPIVLVITGLLSSLSCPVRAGKVSGDSGGLEPRKNVTLAYLRRTVDAVHGALDFFQRNHQTVNLDAVIGTRMVEGSLKVLIANLEQKHQTTLLPADIMTDIRGLYQLSKQVSDDAEPNVSRTQPKYYQRIGPTIQEGLWELNYSSRRLSPSVASWSYKAEEAMAEKESDDCLTELFGTGKTDEKCVISDKCWERMTSFGYSQYSLSHEIFYLQIGEEAGCLAQMVWKILMNEQPGLHVLQDTFCANMLREAVTIAEADFPATHQDLFMEQAALCGFYGYKEFFYYNWLDMILSWQDTAHGCFKWAGWPRQRISGNVHHVTKREERRLDNGCLCHRTTVAAAALAQYIRYLIEAYLA